MSLALSSKITRAIEAAEAAEHIPAPAQFAITRAILVLHDSIADCAWRSEIARSKELISGLTKTPNMPEATRQLALTLREGLDAAERKRAAFINRA